MKIFENFKKDNVSGSSSDRWSRHRTTGNLPDTYEFGMNCFLDLIEDNVMRQRIYKRIKGNPHVIEIDRHGKTLSLFGVDANLVIDTHNKIVEEIKHSRTYIDRGIDLAKQGKYENAIKSFDKAIEFDKDSAQAWLNKGHSLGALKRVDDSIASFNKAIELDPQVAEIFKERGLLDNTGKKFKYKSEDVVFEDDKNSAETLAEKGYHLESLGKYKEAIKYLDDALKLNPKSGKILLCKYICLDHLDRKKEASECFRKIFDVDPEVGVIYIDALLEQEPNNVMALMQKGFLLRKLEKYEAAMECIDKILTLEPDHPLASDVKNALEIIVKNKYMKNR